MKKILSMILVLSMLLAASAALAEGMGVQVIGGQDSSTQPVSLDDIQLEATVEIPGWGDITPLAYAVQDCVMVRKPGQLGRIWRYTGTGSDKPDGYDKYFEHNLKIECQFHTFDDYKYWVEDWITHYESGTQAEYAFLGLDILNTTADRIDYLKDYSVKVIFDDRVEYAGWCYQCDMDLNRCTWLDSSNNFVIDPYYVGHYVFGCTLPNSVINGKAPLRMVITLDGKEITYNIRK